MAHIMCSNEELIINHVDEETAVGRLLIIQYHGMSFQLLSAAGSCYSAAWGSHKNSLEKTLDLMLKYISNYIH